MVLYGRLKKHFKIVILKVVAVTYKRWSLRRGSKYSGATSKLLLFWKTCRQGDVVSTRCSTVVADPGERPVGTSPIPPPYCGYKKKKLQNYRSKKSRQGKQNYTQGLNRNCIIVALWLVKVYMKRNHFFIILKVQPFKDTIPKFEPCLKKIGNFITPENCAILLSKMVFESHGQNALMT